MTEKAAPKTPKAAKPVTVVTPEPATAPKTNILSIVALVTGIAGLTVIPFVSSIVAVVTGHMARKEVRRTGEQGDGLALAGLITGYIGLCFGLVVIGIIVFFVVVSFIGITASSGMNYNY